jgi:ATP/maltotriose-dependent transcriptional regulator MalT
MGHFISGEFDAALALTHESYELSRSIGNAWGQAYSMMMTSIVAIERGDLQAAIDGMEEALQVSIEGGFLAPAIEMRSALAYAFALLGFADQASAHANAALATAQAAGFTEVGGELAILAYIELQRGSPAAADAYLAQARATLSSQDVYSYNPVLVGLVSGFVLLAQGEPEQAVAIVSELLAAQGQAGIQSFALDLGHIQARGYLALGRLDEAEAVLAGLRARAEQQRALRMLWAIQALQADIAEQLGRSAEARALRQMASAHIDTIASRFTNPLFRDAFLSQPDVQALLAAERPGTPAP